MANLACIIQARSTSARFPDKMRYPFLPTKQGPMSLIQWIVYHVFQSTGQTPIVAIPTGDSLKEHIAEMYLEKPVDVFEGNEKDVLKRYYDCMKHYDLKAAIRVSGDSPFYPSEYLAAFMYWASTMLMKTDDFFITNCGTFKVVDGWELDAFSMACMEKMNRLTPPDMREHVTLHVKKNPMQYQGLKTRLTFYTQFYNPKWFPKMSIDNKQDMEQMTALSREMF